MRTSYDVIIIGAGAAGLFCAFNTAARGKSVLVLDHANKVGKKILMSGGGRCNFTNLYTTHENFSSNNPHFCKSALSQYTAYDFLSLVENHNIAYVEKAAGQLFCKESSKDILNMLLEECSKYSVKIYKRCNINKIKKVDNLFHIETDIASFEAGSLVVATGGLSIPTLGASGFGYKIGKQFGHELVETSASLVPFVLEEGVLNEIKHLSGVSVRAEVKIKADNRITIKEDLLFTHRGLSGPVILMLSEYWHKGQEIVINLLPEVSLEDIIKSQNNSNPDSSVVNVLAKYIPKKLSSYICGVEFKASRIKQLNTRDIKKLSEKIHNWHLTPLKTEGYKTAEVTRGGISTSELSSRTMESKLTENLYFIGEVIDVTGQLGGYNFQWAWSSAWCAAQAIK